MIRISFFILIPVLLFLFSSCKKENLTGPRHLQGQVIDKTTGEGVGNSYVYLRSKRKLEDSERTIQAKITDSQGNFTFDFNYSGDSVYSVWAIKDGYFQGSISRTFVSPTKPNEFVTVPLQPEGYLRYHIKNIADTATYMNINGVLHGPFYGFDVDTVFIATHFGNTEVVINYFVGQTGNTTRFTKKVFCPAHDTTDYQIFY